MLAVTATPSATVLGQNTTWNGTLTTISSYSGTVNLSCLGAAPGTCIVNPSSLVPMASGAPFTVTVGNATTGAFSFSIQGTDGTLTHTQAVSLAVNTDATWTDTGATSATVAAGQSVSYTFSAAPVGGTTFTGAVNFACANLPAQTSCGFNPTSITAGAGTTAVTLTISTAGPNVGTALRKAVPSSQFSVPSEKPEPPRTGGGRMTIALAWLLMIPLAGMILARSARREVPRSVIAANTLALVWLALLAACGGLGGGGGGGGGGVTVTVSPASAGLFANEPGNSWPASATQRQFSATVDDGSSQTVTWAVTGGDTNGSIDSTGLYTAPANVPSPATLSVTATSSLATSPGSAQVTILQPTAVGTYSNIQVTATAVGGAAHADLVTLTVN